MTSVKSAQVFFGVESVMCVNAYSLLLRAATTSTSGTLNDLTTDLIMAKTTTSISSELLICGGHVRSIVLLPLVARCLETIDVCI